MEEAAKRELCANPWGGAGREALDGRRKGGAGREGLRYEEWKSKPDPSGEFVPTLSFNSGSNGSKLAYS